MFISASTKFWNVILSLQAHFLITMLLVVSLHAHMVDDGRRVGSQHHSVHVHTLIHQLARLVQLPANSAKRPVDLHGQVVLVEERHLGDVDLPDDSFLCLDQNAAVVVAGVMIA